MNPLIALSVHPFTLTYQAQQAAEFPEFFGSMLRGVFGRALLQLEQDGLVKPLGNQRVSDFLFNNLLADTHPWHKEYKEPPRGFWFSLSDTQPNHYAVGDIFQCKFTLCGNYLSFLPILLPVFITMGKNGLGKRKGTFELLSITEETIHANNTLIWQKGQESLEPVSKGISYRNFQETALQNNTLSIHYVSPTALNKSHNVYGGIPFMDLVEILAKRITLLSNIYCSEDFYWDKRYSKENIRNINIIESHLHWENFLRRSNRKNEIAPIEGYVGTVVYEGRISFLEHFLPLLLLGQYTHIGRNIPFGGGKYIVDEKCYAFI